MKYFVTGANGFIGKNICQRLEDDGRIVVKYNHVNILSIPRDTEHIIHLAAEIHNEGQMFEGNVTLTMELLEAAKDLKNLRSFIYVGSSSEYGEYYTAMKENDVLEPRTIYEATKGCGTLLAQAFAREFRMPIIIVRPFSVYGPGEPKHRLFPTLLRATTTGEHVDISRAVHDFVYIKDFVSALLQIEKLICEDGPIRDSLPDIVNIGSGKQIKNVEVARAVRHVTGKELAFSMINTPLRPFDSEHWCADITKLNTVYNYHNKYDLETGIYDWVKHENSV